ncbi:MAG: polysaccharide pyruvyl transferase CsaB, partial [Syntrophomonadaceae bacterium]|nr:polysaccharide pyruvyl transferase CsaB [Syntrophomonadaceae bacterium]
TQGERCLLLIVLSGYYGFDNAGDEALLSAICSSIRRIEPGAQFVVLSGCPQKTENLHQLPAVNRMSPWQVLKVLRKADLLISGGGSLFQDVTGPRSLPYYISIVALAKILGKPVIFYAQGVGPIQRRFSKLLMRWWGNKVELITLRDNNSRELLRELGVVRPPTYVTADPVFTLDPAAEHYVRTAALLERYQLKAGKLLGISVRPWSALINMRSELARLLDTLVREGYQVVFIPMNYSQDLPESRLIASMMQEQATVLEENLSSMEMIALMTNFKMAIGMRLHSLIFAATRGIPFAGISYDPKIDAFLQSFGLEPLNGPYEKMYEEVSLLLQDENRQEQIRLQAEDFRNRAEQNAPMALSLIK